MINPTDTQVTPPSPRKSIKTKFQLIMVILVVFSTLLISMLAIESIHHSYYSLNQMVTSSLEEHYKSTVKNDVETIATILEAYTKDVKDEKIPLAVQNQMKFLVRNAHYDKEGDNWDGYFFLYDLNGTVIAHGSDPLLEGKNLISLKDSKGQFIIKNLLDAAKHGGGYVNYLWNKPTDPVGKYKKISYAELIPNSPWWLGTGIYVDNIDQTIAALLAKQKTELKRLLLQFIVLTIALIVLSFLIALYYSTRISKPIIALSAVAKKISSGDYHVRAEVKTNDELSDMATSFNEMADSINEKIKNLVHKEHYTARLLESIAEGLIIADENNIIVQNNPAAEKILGFNKDELIGKSIELLIPKELQDEMNVLDPALQSKTLANNIERHRKDGSSISLVVTAAPVIENNKLIRYRIYSFFDVTEQNKLRTQVKQMENLKKYFPSHIAEKLIEGGDANINLGYDRKKVTIFFSDLVGFTDLSDTLEPEEILSILREYFTVMSDIVYQYSGTLDKFIGDAIMVFFGAPTTSGIKEDAINCVSMALAMQEKLVLLNKKWNLPTPLKIRMGINTGYVTVGNFGSEIRLEYTIIGTPVNIASRLEHECTPNSILVSFDTAQLIKEQFELQEKEALKLKGIHNLVTTFEVIKKL